jgi:Dolichyl-phosphate-mannose-protein mannosyltransferase
MAEHGQATRRGWGCPWIVPLALALATSGWLLAVEGRQGLARDEAQYFRAGERYWGWFEELGDAVRAGKPGRAFSRAVVDSYWGDNHEHPPLMKTLYGLSWRLFHRCDCVGPKQGLHPIAIHGKHRTLPLFSRESTAFRFPAILLAGLGVALVYGFARRLVGPWAAAGAAVLSVAQPHYFFHAQISCFDVPIAVMALLVGWAYWKSLRSPRWGILCGVFYGLALATKHNAWLIPCFLLVHYLWMRRGDFLRLRPPRIPLAFVSMASLGPLVLFALWPWLWHSPVPRVREWMQRHAQHEHYNFEYLGRNWNLPPPPAQTGRWLLRATFPFVSAGFTVPVTTLALAAAGAVVLARRRRRDAPTDESINSDPPEPGARASWLRPGADVDLAPGMFLAVQILGPLGTLALPSTPIFGGVKHFLAAMPFLAMLAGVGMAWVTRQAMSLVRPSRLRHALPAALAGLLCLPAVAETQRSHPDGVGHYNLLAGGFAGGATLGMNRQFWGYSVLPLLPWMKAHRPPSNRIYWHDVLHDAVMMYVRDGRLPLGIGDTGVGESVVAQSDLGLVILEKHFAVYEYLHWEAFQTTQPAQVYAHEGVPFVVVYQRKAPPPRQEPLPP